MKRKELFWMLVPCLLLAVVGFALRGRPGVTLPWNEPFVIVVEKVEKELLTPREVADGWDTKLKVTLTHKGRTPRWWGQALDSFGSNEGARLFYEHKGKQSAVKMRSSDPPGDYILWRPRWDAESNRYVAGLQLRRAKMQPHPGSVKVQARFLFEQNNKALRPPLRWEYTVRRPGETVKVPAVSRKTHLHIEKVIVQDVPPAKKKMSRISGYLVGDTQILWKGRATDKDEITNYTMGVEAFIHDEHGQVYNDTSTGSEGTISAERNSSLATVDFDLKTIPRRAGALTVRGKIGIGSHWPLTVEVPIRDKQGRILKTPRTPAPFTISSIEVRPADAESQKESGCDTVISIGIRFTQPQKYLSHEDWQTDWSPHLVDETGKEYWAFKTPYPVGPQPLNGGVSYTKERTDSVRYAFPLNQVPPNVKTLKFKTQISYNHSALVPVEVLIRKNGVTQWTSQEPLF